MLRFSFPLRWKADFFPFTLPHLAKPQVLLIGQYSVGKTSFIRYLLGRDFPGQRIGNIRIIYVLQV
jgi:polynucleotide 5'-kinase involved in rRNA processing